MTGYELATKTVSLRMGWHSQFEDEEKLYTTAIEKLKAEGWEEDPTRTHRNTRNGFNWIVLIRQFIE